MNALLSVDWAVLAPGLPPFFVPVSLALFGLVIGSFLNVCIYRLPIDKSVVKPRSFCPSCGHTIKAFDNIPVVSFVLLRGKCRHCGARISWRYPVVEVSTALLFLAAYQKYGLGVRWLFFAFFLASMLVLILTDLDHQILPNEVTYPGIVIGWLSSWFNPDLTPLGSFVAALIGSGFLLILAVGYFRLKKVEGMGIGDVKMIAVIGAFLGLEKMFLTLVLGSVLGLLIGGTIILVQRKGLRHPIPFGTFLGAAAMVAWYYGDGVYLAWKGIIERLVVF